MNENIDVSEIFENARKDPTLFSTVDIQNLLDSIENEKNDYLEDKTLSTVQDDILESLEELEMSEEDTKQICKKLMEYRYVEEINELHTGKHMRWIRKTNKKLTNGGIIMDIKFLDTGTQILCKNASNKFIQIKFDDCIIYQKLSVEEQLILLAYENSIN
jgi:hypothetical protein